MEILAIIPIILIAAFTLGELFKRVGLPTVVGQIIAGLLFGLPGIKELFFWGKFSSYNTRFFSYPRSSATTFPSRIRD